MNKSSQLFYIHSQAYTGACINVQIQVFYISHMLVKLFHWWSPFEIIGRVKHSYPSTQVKKIWGQVLQQKSWKNRDKSTKAMTCQFNPIFSPFCHFLFSLPTLISCRHHLISCGHKLSSHDHWLLYCSHHLLTHSHHLKSCGQHLLSRS